MPPDGDVDGKERKKIRWKSYPVCPLGTLASRVESQLRVEPTSPVEEIPRMQDLVPFNL